MNIFIIALLITVANAKFPDWLITDIDIKTTLVNGIDGTLVLSNGLITRTFMTSPGFTTVEYYSHEKKSSILRALNPEAIIGLDGKVYAVGEVKTDIPRGYLNRTALKENLHASPESFQYVGYKISDPVAPYHYTPMRGAPKNISWPPKGLRLDVFFRAPVFAPYYHQFVSVCIHYEMYDGIPLMSKWVSVYGEPVAQENVKVSIYSVEVLSVNQQWTQESFWDGPYNAYNWFYIETDQTHGTNIQWTIDPHEDELPGSFEPMFNATYDVSVTMSVPCVKLTADGFQSFHVHELAIGSSDETRKALSRHRMFRLLAPQAQENPIFFHLTQTDDQSFKNAVDQLAEVGFEMIIYSFSSGFNFESKDESYIQKIKKQVEYANSKGIEVGGYDLIVLDRYDLSPEYRIVDLNNRTLGNACLASKWYEQLYDMFMEFIDKTGLTMVETDGPYGGNACASKSHLHHVGYEDSVYKQTLLQGEFFKELRRRNMYINQPDDYWYQGGSRTGLGYNENQYSLPRWEDLSISRQSLFDRIYNYIPTAGWMFLPLVDYHGGGAEAAFEPLNQNIVAYQFGLAQYLGAGVAACYRGYRIYDTNETKAMVTKWVSFYKKYRDIITSDIVRVRRPDMQSIDSYMHVNYRLKDKGLVMVFNPTTETQSMLLTLPLYYTGISEVAIISEKDENPEPYTLDKGWEVEIKVELPPLEITWYVIRDSTENN
ncbi:uncharacterized protein LOC100206309 isoform X1 [Hydra vulgaris]|uniref:uncharacterized protein LOC100206309 isoform X1 n=1 Tax=Hydra vulgaris TaxID=6087 RepID=UPI001F5FA68A|nr:uncharacterized protein LOC100206309 [Hydra vulgaris]